MKIYLASSWKNKEIVILTRDYLKSQGHEVDCFCDGNDGRFSFNWGELIHTALGVKTHREADAVLLTLDAKDMMKNPVVQRAFAEDKKYIDWADVVVLILPAGKSSHLEAGYAKGRGKRLFILGGFQKGEFETMYGFADGLYDDLQDLANAI